MEGRGGPREVAGLATAPRQRIWSAQDEPTRRALRLLSRFDLPAEDPYRVLDGATGTRIEIHELFENPYHLVTCTIDDASPIRFEVVDRGCFPDLQVTDRHPLSVEPTLDDPIDERRVGAAMVTVLRRAENSDGHTLLTTTDMLERLGQLTVARALTVTPTVLQGLGLDPQSLDDDPEATWPRICRSTLSDGTAAYKLRSAAHRRDRIRLALNNLKAGPRHELPTDLERTLNQVLGHLDRHDPKDRTAELRARQEKHHALQELFAARLYLMP